MAGWIIFCCICFSVLTVTVYGYSHDGGRRHGPSSGEHWPGDGEHDWSKHEHDDWYPHDGRHKPPWSDDRDNSKDYDDDNDDNDKGGTHGPRVAYIVAVILGGLSVVFILAAIALYRLKRSKLHNKVDLDPRSTVVSAISYPPPYETIKQKRPLPYAERPGLPPVERTAPPAYEDYIPPRTPPPPYTFKSSELNDK